MEINKTVTEWHHYHYPEYSVSESPEQQCSGKKRQCSFIPLKKIMFTLISSCPLQTLFEAVSYKGTKSIYMYIEIIKLSATKYKQTFSHSLPSYFLLNGLH